MDYVAFLIEHNTTTRLKKALKTAGATMDDSSAAAGLILAWSSAKRMPQGRNMMSYNSMMDVLIDHFGFSSHIWGARIDGATTYGILDVHLVHLAVPIYTVMGPEWTCPGTARRTCGPAILRLAVEYLELLLPLIASLLDHSHSEDRVRATTILYNRITRGAPWSLEKAHRVFGQLRPQSWNNLPLHRFLAFDALVQLEPTHGVLSHAIIGSGGGGVTLEDFDPADVQTYYGEVDFPNVGSDLTALDYDTVTEEVWKSMCTTLATLATPESKNAIIATLDKHLDELRGRVQRELEDFAKTNPGEDLYTHQCPEAWEGHVCSYDAKSETCAECCMNCSMDHRFPRSIVYECNAELEALGLARSFFTPPIKSSASA